MAITWSGSQTKLRTWKDSRLASWKTLNRIFRYSTRRDRVFLTASIIASVCAGATLPLMNILFARLVNTFSTPTTSQTATTPASFMSVINEYVLYIVYLFLGRVLLAYIAIIGFRTTSLRISAAVRLHYLEALFQLPISTLDALPSGQTAAIITITANALQLGISERLSSLIQAVAVIVVSLVIGCVYSWTLTLATSSGVILIFVWYAVFTPLIVKKYAVIQEVERQAASVVSESLSSIRMVAACGAEAKMARKYSKIVDQARDLNKAMSPYIAIQHSPVFFTIFAQVHENSAQDLESFALCFYYAVKLYMSFQFASVEALVVVLMSIMTMIAHLSGISVPLTAASSAINAANILFSIIDAPKPKLSGIESFELTSGDIDCKGINFTYPTRHDVRVLNDFNLHIPAGQTTAIVGPSGSGKSTIVGLILRWYDLGDEDPIANYLRNGTITIGDVAINTVNLHCWRAQIGLVQQDPFLFDDTIYKNVEYGLVGTQYEHASDEIRRNLVEQACNDAYANEFIRHLPEGYDTSVGQAGLQLSGGQRQRLAIARAIVRRPKILIFDEATSALDVASERIVQAALRKAAKGRTTIVIAHRLSTIKAADQIVVVAQGRVIEKGTHHEMLRNIGGPYWKLVNAQQLASNTVHSGVGVWRESYNRRGSALLEKDSQETLVEQNDFEFEDIQLKGQINRHESSDVVHALDRDTLETKSDRSSNGGILQSFSMLIVEQRRYVLSYIVMLLAAAGAGSTSSIQAYLFARLISGFSYWGAYLVTSTSFLCAMLVVVAVGVAVSYFTLGWLSNNVSTQTISTYREEYFRNTIRKPIPFFDESSHAVGLLTANIASDPSQLQQLLGMNMAMVMISLFNVIGCIAIAITFHWKFGLVVIVSSLPIILAGGWYRVRHEIRFESRNNQVFADSARFATEAISGIRTVASLTLERAVCQRYDRMLNTHIQKSWKDSRYSCVVFAMSDSMILLCMAFSLWYGSSLLANGSLDSFHFLTVYLAVIQGSMAAGQWLSFGPNIAQVSAAANRIRNMRDENGELETRIAQTYTSKHQWQIPPMWNGADIELRNVWFQYPTRNVPVLQGCSLRVYPGQFAAIVGSSGAGKTSIISLLERFYEPHSGSIRYNGENFKLIPSDVLRKKMALVAQEACIFGGTIRENLLLGVEDDISEKAIHEVCRDAGIHDFISSLPDGYNTDVGKAGVSLSGGQRQRVSIARALIRNPSVLLLDEATSSLDSTTEKEVQAVFEETAKGRTMIVVAHRLSTVQNADVIFVMHEGRVIETGDHKGLLRQRGTYWRMCEAQALST